MERLKILVQVIGENRAVQALNRVSGAQAGLATATKISTAQLSKFNASALLSNQVLFTLRRAVFYSTLALAGLGAVAAKMGLNYFTAVQSAEIGFRRFGLTTEETKKQLDDLYKLASLSPFEYAPLLREARYLHAVGLEAQYVVPLLQGVADVLSTMDRTTEPHFRRVIQNLGEIQTTGRVSMVQLRNLGRLDFPALDILSEQLNISSDELKELVESGRLTGRVAFPLLIQGMQEARFAGAAAESATATLVGVYSTFKDFVSRVSGLLLTPVFKEVQNALFRWGQAFSDIGDKLMAAPEGVPKWKIALAELDKLFGARGNLKDFVGLLIQLWRVITVLIIPAFQMAAAILKIFLPIIWLLTQGLKLLADQAGWLKWVIAPLIARMIFLRIVMASSVFKRILWASSLAKGIKFLIPLVRLLAATLLTRLIPVLRAVSFASTVAWIAALGPIGLIIAGVVALTGALVILYFKWDAFHDLVNDTFNFIKDNWNWFEPFARILPLVDIMIRVFRGFYELLKAIINIIKSPLDVEKWAKLPRALLESSPLPGPVKAAGGWILGKIGLAEGGIIQSSGMALVGERGPELLTLPRGAMVEPLMGRTAGTEQLRPIIVEVKLDRKVIARAVAAVNEDQRARA